MLGVIVELVMEVQDSYNLVFATTLVPLQDEEDHWEENYQKNRHLSYYYPGGTPNAITMRRNSWNLTNDKSTIFDPFLRVYGELRDHLIASFFPQLLDKFGKTKSDDILIQVVDFLQPSLTLPSYLAFARQLYYQHDEIEYGIPIENRQACLNEVRQMLEIEGFHCVIEVRFAPDTTQALFSPGTAGRGRGGTCFVQLAPAYGVYGESRIDEVYRKFEIMIVRKYGGRPHLGKKMYLTRKDMEEIYGEIWRVFEDLRKRWDPLEKFIPPGNIFLRTLFK